MKTPEKVSKPSMIGRNSLSGGFGSLLPDQERRGSGEENTGMRAEDFRARAM